MKAIAFALLATAAVVAALARPARAELGGKDATKTLPLMDRVVLRLARQASRADHRARAMPTNSGLRERTVVSKPVTANHSSNQQRSVARPVTRHASDEGRLPAQRTPSDRSWLGQLRFGLAARAYRSAQDGVAKCEAQLNTANRLVTKESDYREMERWIWDNLDASRRAGLVVYEEFKPWDGTIIRFSTDTSWSPHWTLSSKGMKLLEYTTPEAKARAIEKASQRLGQAKTRAAEALSNLNRLSAAFR